MSKTRTPASDLEARRSEGGGTEGGYVLATTALLLIPLMIFAALAVDVGGWYSRAAQIQRASDAAALAAVVWMPDTDRATAVALQTAKANGFDDDDPDVSVQLTILDSQSVRVDITADGESYFGGVVIDDDIAITRFSSAEYILPVPMGNPSSALGTGNLSLLGGPNENMWLAVSGYCTGRQQGDAVSARYQLTSYLCPRATPYTITIGGTNYSVTPPATANELNPQYDPEGYYLVIDMPAASTGTSYDVQIFDPGYCDPRAEGVYRVGSTYPSLADTQAAANELTPVLLETRMYAADTTQITDTDNIVPSNLWGSPSVRVWPASTCGWQTAYTIPSNAQRGRWLMNFRSQPVTTQLGLNVFGVRVVTSATTLVCTNTGPASPCPKVYAKDRLSIYAPSVDKNGTAMATPGSPASFFLAEISEVHAGKTLEVTLFDPGEGMNNLQVIAPDLSRHPFTFETIDSQLAQPTANVIDTMVDSGGSVVAMSDIAETASSTIANCSISATVAASDPTTPAAGSYDCLDVSNWAFQNRTVRVSIEIPNSYTCAPGVNGCWWRVRYEPEATVPPTPVTDRTVWSVRVVGDPIRLSE